MFAPRIGGGIEKEMPVHIPATTCSGNFNLEAWHRQPQLYQ
jgi:hypothetical protein